MSYQSIEVHNSIPHIGAEIRGVDLSNPLGNQQFQEVHHALMDRLVIFFRDQKLGIEQHKDFARRFGKLHVRMRLGRPNLLAGLRAYPGHPTFTPAGATATPMAPPRSIALCKKPDIRTSSINALTSASAAGRSFGTTIFCGTLNRSSGNSLVPGVAAERVAWSLNDHS